MGICPECGEDHAMMRHVGEAFCADHTRVFATLVCALGAAKLEALREAGKDPVTWVQDAVKGIHGVDVVSLVDVVNREKMN